MITIAYTDRPHQRVREHRWDVFAGVAAAVLEGRERGYTSMVEDGRLERDEADRRIAIMRATIEIWSAAWACRLPDPAVVGSSDRADILAELTRAHGGTARALERDPGDPAAEHQLACLDEMIAIHRRFVDGPIFFVRLTHQLRKQREANNRKEVA